MTYTNNVLEKETTKTALEPIVAIEALYASMEDVSPESLCCLVAQSAFETARWAKIYNYNFGNIKAPDTRPHMYLKGASEIINGKEIFPQPPDPQCRFAAYPDVFQGAKALVTFLSVDTTPDNGKPNRYAAAWSECLAGDLAGFVHELSRAGYFTADVGVYLRGCQICYDRYYSQCLQVAAPEPDVRALAARIEELENWAKGIGYKV
jgi:hypothetical protein